MDEIPTLTTFNSHIIGQLQTVVDGVIVSLKNKMK